MKAKRNIGIKIVCNNRKAKFNYFFLELLEAGIVLKGSEVKSLRDGKANITDAYASDNNGIETLFSLKYSRNSDVDKLSVKSVIVNQGMRLKRMKARARGRADRIIKPTCHIEIILVEEGK